MGVLLAHYLQKYPDEKLQKSLSLYIKYVLRELLSFPVESNIHHMRWTSLCLFYQRWKKGSGSCIPV